MLQTRMLGAAPSTGIVAATPENAELLNAVSNAASEAATEVVSKGLIGFAAISIASIATRKMGLGFVKSAVVISGISFFATQALKKSP